MPLYKVIVEKHQDGYVAYPLGLSYALPISMGELIISLMTNQAYDTSSRRCSPREIVITPASANLCPVGQVFRGQGVHSMNKVYSYQRCG
ncbi:MAG: hypothetical protein KA063_00915 [Firmicutes bacterium]|nr:hypothetical protein [Bacillota bacterium]